VLPSCSASLDGPPCPVVLRARELMIADLRVLTASLAHRFRTGLREPCIEIEYPLGKPVVFTVDEYDHGLRRARYFSDHALAFHGLTWARGAPQVQDLTSDGQPTVFGYRVRIVNWDAYAAQMDRLLGLV
jgi:hypothetical protein